MGAVEQINTLEVAQISRSRQLQDLAAVPPPPDDCEAFVVEPVKGADFYATQVSAMLIAQRLALPTINGASGHFPPGWSLNKFDSPITSACKNGLH